MTGTTQKSGNRQRNSNLELLRIISMILIVFFHASRNISQTSYVAKAYNYLSGMWGIMGVDLFIIISAYFLVDQKFKSRRLIDILIRTAAYIILMTIPYLFCLIHQTGGFFSGLRETMKYHVNALLSPLWTDVYWFVTAYVFMVLLSPLLNCLLNRLEIRQMRALLILFCFIPVFTNFGGGGKLYDIFNFLYVYFLVGYLKRSGFTIRKKKMRILLPCLLAVLMIFGRFIDTIDSASGIFEFLKRIVGYSFGNDDRHSVFMLIEALLIFDIFINLKPFTSGIINSVSSHTLGIYLFHENQFITRVIS